MFLGSQLWLPIFVLDKAASFTGANSHTANRYCVARRRSVRGIDMVVDNLPARSMRSLGSVPRVERVAMLSVHTSPVAMLGGKDAGGLNVYVCQLARQLDRLG